MKRQFESVLCITLACIITILIVGCGNTAGGESSRRVEFEEPILLAEGERARIYITGMYELDNAVNSHGERIRPKYIQLKIENTSDVDINVQPQYCYIGEEQVVLAASGPSGSTIPTGRTNSFEYSVQIGSAGIDVIPIDNFDDLYDLEGSFQVVREDEIGHYDENGHLIYGEEIAFSLDSLR